MEQENVFLDDLWFTSADCCLYTEASGTGVGGVFKSEWFTALFTPEETSRSIIWCKLFTVVVACQTWGIQLTGKRLLL
jgi:hypothetical protein